MPQSKYTNADLKRFERKPLGITVEKQPRRSDVAPYDPSQEVDIDQLLTDAKGSLGRANDLSAGLQDEYDLIDESSNLRPDVERYNAEVPSVMDREGSRLSKLILHYIKTRPEAIEAIAPVASFLGGPVGMGAQAVMAGSSARNLLDDEPDSAMGTGMDVLSLVGGGAAALHGLRGVVRGRQAASAATAAIAARANAASDAAQTRYLARGLEDAGFSKGAIKKSMGIGPRSGRRPGTGIKPRRNYSVSEARPVSHNQSGDYIGRVMDEVGEMDAAASGRYPSIKRPAGGWPAKQQDSLAGLRRAADTGVPLLSPDDILQALSKPAGGQIMGPRGILLRRRASDDPALRWPSSGPPKSLLEDF